MTYQSDAKLPEAPYWGFSHPAIGRDWRQEWFMPSWIYVIASGRDERPVKIGYAGDIKQRIAAFEAGNPYGLRAVHTFPTFRGIARQVERRVHDVFAAKAMGREWFDLHADEAASPIPRWCELGRMAIEAYRDAILSDDEATARANAAEAEYRDRGVIISRARADVGLERARRDMAERPVYRGPVARGGSRSIRLSRYKLARGIVD